MFLLVLILANGVFAYHDAIGERDDAVIVTVQDQWERDSTQNVLVTFVNFEPKEILIKIYDYEDTENVLVTDTVTENAPDTNDVWLYTVDVPNNLKLGRYYVYVEAVDNDGNTVNELLQIEVIEGTTWTQKVLLWLDTIVRIVSGSRLSVLATR